MLRRDTPRRRLTALAGAAFALCALGVRGWAFTIELIPSDALLMNSMALSAFERAAQEWESRIDNDVTVYVKVDYSTKDQSGRTFSPFTIGSTSYASYLPNDLNLDYDTVRNALAARATRPGDEILAFLPTSAQVTAMVPNGATFDNTTIGILRANQRVLGLLSPTDTQPDGFISFNSAFTFDFDRSNGIGSGLIDFETAAVHEIGHLLGFLSDVDDFANQPTLSSDNLTTLDLFRFPTTHQPLTMSAFTTFARVLTPGTASVFSDTQVAYAMSTGIGNQASHWLDDGSPPFPFEEGNLIGIMDPTLDYGVTEFLKGADLRAFELIGYNIIPEPGSALLLVVGIACFAFRRRR